MAAPYRPGFKQLLRISAKDVVCLAAFNTHVRTTVDPQAFGRDAASVGPWRSCETKTPSIRTVKCKLSCPDPPD